MTSKKMIALNFSQEPHHLDHIGILAVIMGIPLLVSSRTDELIGQRYYPDLQILYVPNLTDAIEANDYDVLLATYFVNKILNEEISDIIEKKHHAPVENWFSYTDTIVSFKEKRKKIKHLYCPHGFSDKNYYIEPCLREDYLLVYGQSNLDMFKEMGLFDQLPPYVITGNFRYQYYLQHKEFFQEIIHREVFSYFKEKLPCVLYAPSLRDRETDTSFFTAIEKIIDRLPNHYNLIVKLHPRLENNDPWNYMRILAKYRLKQNVLFLSKYPLVYPLLDLVDIYLGDSSSIGYDFLAFNKPLYFLKQENVGKEKDRVNRYKSGVVIERENYDQIWDIIEDTLPDSHKFNNARIETYQYAFGQPKSLTQVKSEILKMLETS